MFSLHPFPYNDHGDINLEEKLNKVRHAGRVQVRGMIRRVWRPRYLELDKDGVLRYYEASGSPGMDRETSLDHRTSTKRHKKKRQQQQQQHLRQHHPQSDDHTTGQSKNGSGLIPEMQAFSLPPTGSKGGQSETDAAMSQKIQDCEASLTTSTKDTSVLPSQEHATSDLTFGSDDEIGVVVQESYIGQPNKTQQQTTTNKPTSYQRQHKDGKQSSEVERIGSWDHISEATLSASHNNKTKKKSEVLDQSILKNKKQCHPDSCVQDRSHEGLVKTEESLGSAPVKATEDIQPRHVKKQIISQNLQHHLHHHRPKSTMTILSARIIDVHTLSDMHVGLPKERFGFVFCGRPLFIAPGDSSIHEPSEISDDLCHPLSILATEHDYFATSRDYLCSVSTLEEAQSWVVALNWAAKVAIARSNTRRRHNIGSLFEDGGDDDTLDGNDMESSHNSDDSYRCDDELLLSALSPNRHLIGRKRNALIESFGQASRGNNNHGTNTASHATEGIIIVTKVPSFHLQWRRRGLLYKVQMLLLRSSQLWSRTQKRKESQGLDKNEDEEWTVEERTVYQSFDDFLLLVNNLYEEYIDESSKKPDMNTKDIELLINLLDESRSKLLRSKREQTSLNLNVMFKAYVESIEVVNTVLRNLSTNGISCNCKIVRDFLSLQDQDISIQRHNTEQLIPHQQKRTNKKALVIQVGESTDEFVQRWLFGGLKEDGKKEALHKVMILLQSPLASMLLSLIFIWGLYISGTIWSHYLTLSVTMRVDIILVSNISMFYAGKMIANMDRHETKRHDTKIIRNQDISKVVKSPESRQSLSATRETTENEHADPTEIIADDTTVEDDNSSTSDDSLLLSSPLPLHSDVCQTSCWSKPDEKIFKVRGKTYLQDRVKVPSAPSPFPCRGVDVWLSDNPERHIARHPSVLGGKLGEEDTFVVNFLLPFGNFVSYFSIPDVKQMPPNVAKVWTKFINGDQQYRDARLKMLPIVIDGPWIVKKAVGPGTAPALLGAVIPIQYYFTKPTATKKGTYEVDIIISASRLANSILTVVKGHTKKLTIAFAFIIEGRDEEELPETVLCSFTLHSLHLEHCPHLPTYIESSESTDDEG